MPHLHTEQCCPLLLKLMQVILYTPYRTQRLLLHTCMHTFLFLDILKTYKYDADQIKVFNPISPDQFTILN